MPERLFLLQNGLYDQHTHYFSETVAYREAVERIGMQMLCYANRRIAPQMAELLGVKPTFSLFPGQIGSRDRHCAELSDYVEQSRAFLSDCCVMDKDGCSVEDYVFVPYALPAEIYGLARWLERRPPAERPRVMLVFHHPDLRWKALPDRKSVRGNFSFWRHAFLELVKLVPADRLFLGATVPQLAGVLGKLAEHPVRHVPLATWWLAEGIAEERRRERSDLERGADLVVCGDYRAEKGRDLVPAVLANVLRARPAMRIRLQVSQKDFAEKAAAELRRATGPGATARVDIRVGQLSQEDFVQRLASSRLALLPYHPARYAMRGSAVFSEAVGYGVPVVVPRGTWLDDCLSAGFGAGVGFDTCEEGDVTGAVLAALDDIDALETRALMKAPAWRKAYNADVLLRMAGLGAATSTPSSVC